MGKKGDAGDPWENDLAHWFDGIENTPTGHQTSPASWTDKVGGMILSKDGSTTFNTKGMTAGGYKSTTEGLYNGYPFTFEVMYKYPSTINSSQYRYVPAGHYRSVSGSSWGDFFGVMHYTSQKSCFFTHVSSSSSSSGKTYYGDDISTTLESKKGKTIVVTFVVNSARTGIFYVDGNPAGTISSPSTNLGVTFNSSKMYSGIYCSPCFYALNATSKSYTGTVPAIYSVRVCNKVMTAAQVKASARYVRKYYAI